MHENQEFLPDILVLLTAAVFVVAIFRQFNLSPVLGFLFAGAAIGPFGFNIIDATDEKNYIAEYGVVFLLFVIGLELSLRRLAEMRSYILGLGGLQLVITAFIISFGIYQLIPTYDVALLVGGALALSSTAIVLQVLEERGERLSQVGRVSFAVLLMQDLAVIPLLILIPIMSGKEGFEAGELENLLLSAVLVVVGMFLFGRYLLNPLLRMVANTNSSELFTATTLLVALAASFATQYAGLSQALGAFLGGLMVAETSFRKQVEADVMPFKALLMGLFFMTIGMNFNLEELVRHFPIVIILSLGLILLKGTIIYLICKLFKLETETSLKSAILLSQGGEFAFILFNLAARDSLIDNQISQLLLLTVTLTMALTPLMYGGITLYYSRLKSKNADQDMEITKTEDLQGHLIICGFGWVGENLAKFLLADHVNFIAVDTEARRVKIGREMGMPVYYGDAARLEILRSLHAEKAKALVVTIHDSKAEIRIIQAVKNTYPNLPIIVRAKHIDSVEQLKKEGATYVVPEAFESSIQIGKLTLRVLGTSDDEINRITQNFREENTGLATAVKKDD
jgi:CPA2 family monovalent cation:H+ antiporter-2